MQLTYAEMKKLLVPGLRYSQDIYQEIVDRYVTDDTTWLDAGCGWHLLPPWKLEAEHELVGRARAVFGVDGDEGALRKHRTLHMLAVSNLEQLPLDAESVNLITCNVVVEHLRRPHLVFAEFARVLQPGGRVIVHTPNAYSHFVLAARCLPRSLKLRLEGRLNRRSAADIYPAYYRANSPRRLRALMARAGLHEEFGRLIASEAATKGAHPLVAALELALIRLTLHPRFKALRTGILASFVKAHA
jgi:ubiquinone/menaquinone biosynthesis C-methylase UbiE